MAEKIIGFIGAGNMGRAIIAGLLASGMAAPENIIASRRNQEALQKLEQDFQIRTTADNREVASKADLLFLAVKPNLYSAIMAEVREFVRPDCVVINLAAGKSIGDVEEGFGRPVKVARIMPNTPVLVREGMIAAAFNDRLTKEEKTELLTLFGSLGKAEEIPESLIDAVIGVSGSSPALMYLLIEAFADGAVRAGMPRAQAYTFAAQAMLGSAKMVLETGTHPGELKDQVCSPGGTTIEAVAAAEETGLRRSILAAVEAAVKKAEEMNRG